MRYGFSQASGPHCQGLSQFLSLYNLGNNVQPPKDVQEKEQFQELHQWIREVLCTEHMFVQVHVFVSYSRQEVL